MRLAIFIDGAYMEKVAGEFNSRVDYRLLCAEVGRLVAEGTQEPLDLLCSYYYDCLPYQGEPPTDEERQRYSGKRNFFNALRYLPRFEVREGRLAFRGTDEHGQPIFQQKRTDMLLGLDIALLSSKKQITHAAVLAGDSDFLPAVEVASKEGVAVWLFHGSASSRMSGYARDLWMQADECCEMNADFMRRVARSPK